jgi:hypothetical protein
MIWIGRITGSAVEQNLDADSPGRLMQVELTAPDDIQSIELFTQAGDDNNPPDDVQCIVLEVSPRLKIIVAVSDGLAPECDRGERELYSQADGEKKARTKYQKDGKVIHNQGARLVARKDDETKSNITIDQAFWGWVNAVSAALGIPTPPTTLTTKIDEGVDSVRVP